MSEKLEVPHVKMQLLRDERNNILIDFEPPLSKGQKSVIAGAHEFIDIPDEAFEFRDYVPKVGNPFTEINCTTIETVVARDNFELNRQNFAERIADILQRQGDIVQFIHTVKPVADGGYWFSGGLTTERPV